MRSSLARFAVACGALALTASCASRTDVRAGHDAREALMAQIQQTEDQLSVARSSLEDSMQSFQTLLEPHQMDVITLFEQFAAKLDLSKEQLESFDEQVLSMDRSAERFFAGWRENFEEFHSAEMRALSEQRLQGVQQKYARIGATIAPIRERCEQLVLMLEDKRLFLEHDLTPAATAFLRADGAQMRTGSGVLFGEFQDIGAVSSRFVAAVDTGDRVVPSEQGSVEESAAR